MHREPSGLNGPEGSVGARPGNSLVAASCHQSVTGLDFGDSVADVEVQSAGEFR